MASSFSKSYQTLLDSVDRVVSWVVIVAMGVLTVAMTTQVFFRYVLNDSLRWGWDVPRLCFIWVIMLSIPLGFRYDVHVGIDVLVQRFSLQLRRAVLIFNAFSILLLSATATYYAILLAHSTWDQEMPGIALPVGLFYVGLFIGQAHTCMHVVRILITGQVSSKRLSEQ